MISTDFAPNESWDDAWLSLKLLFQPRLWKNGRESELVEKELISKFFPNYHIDIDPARLAARSVAGRRSTMVHLFLSGRSALYFLLKSLNLPAGSEVIVQAFTCEAVVLPILELGLKPVYIDIESETFSMNYEKLIYKVTNKTKVLILQHTFGFTPKFRDQILNLAKQRKLTIIEDLAHGFAASIFSSPNYSLLTTNYLLLSFGRSKMLSSVFGGAIISFNNQQLTINNLSLPSYMFIFRCLLYKPLTMFIKSTYDFYVGKILHKILDRAGFLIPEITLKEKSGKYDELFNKAYPNALSLLLHHQLKKFDQIQKQRAKTCSYYTRVILNSSSVYLSSSSVILSGAKDLVPPLTGRNLRFARFLASLGMTDGGLIRFPLLVKNREEVLNKFKKHNIFLGTWYDQVVAPKGLDLNRVGYKRGSCPKAEEICKRIINLPTNITEKEAEKIVKIFNDSL